MLYYKAILKAEKGREELAKEYDVPISAVVWLGDNKYAVVKDGKTIYI